MAFTKLDTIDKQGFGQYNYEYTRGTSQNKVTKKLCDELSKDQKWDADTYSHNYANYKMQSRRKKVTPTHNDAHDRKTKQKNRLQYLLKIKKAKKVNF